MNRNIKTGTENSIYRGSLKSVAITTTQATAEAAKTVTTDTVKYDVKPVFVVTVGDTTKEVTVTNEELQELLEERNIKELTFRLAVPSTMTGEYVTVEHYPKDESTPDWIRGYKVQGTGDDRYVEISSNAFSDYILKQTTSTTYAAKNITKDVSYTTLEEALDVALENDTVQLLANISGEKYVTVETGVTLDLNGHNITGAKFIYVSGNMIDSKTTEEEKGYISASHYFFGSVENYLPIYKTDKGYKFYNVMNVVVKQPDVNNKCLYIFRFNNGTTSEYLAAKTAIVGNAGNGRVKAVISASYTDTEGKSITQDIVYSNDLFNDFAETSNAALSVVFSGFDNLNDELATNSNVVATFKFVTVDANGNEIASIVSESKIIYTKVKK